MRIKRILLRVTISGLLFWFVGLYFVVPYFVSATPSASFVSNFAPYDRSYTVTFSSVVTDPNTGDIYAVGTNAVDNFQYIYQFHSDGTYVTNFTDDLIKHVFAEPPADRIFITPGGKLYATGYDNNTSDWKIVIFDLSSHAVISSFGTAGSGDGQFSMIRDVMLSPINNHLYVLEGGGGNSRVQIFDADGNFISKFGATGSGDGQFSYPSALTVSPVDGTVYVLDNGNHRVQAFDATGNFLRKWGSFGTVTGQFGTYAPSIEVDNTDKVYVLDSNNQDLNHRVQIFTNQGVFVSSFGTSGTADGEFANSEDMTFSPSYDKIYVAEMTSTVTPRIQIFDTATNAYQGKIAYTHLPGPGTIAYSEGIAKDAAGNLYIADSQNYRIVKFDSNDNFVKNWGSRGSGNSQFDYPTAVTVSPMNNHVYVLDPNGRVEVFDTDGNYLSQFGTLGTGDGQLKYGEAIDSDESGNIYVLDSENNRVQVFDANGTFLRKWDSYGGGGQLNYPTGLAYSPINKHVYVYDSSSFRIHIYDTSGNYISSFGGSGSGNGQLAYVEGISIDDFGNVFVADSNNSRVEVFDKDGSFIATWGSNGLGNMQFDYPLGVVNKGSYVYVVDDTFIKKYTIDAGALPPVISTDAVIEKPLSTLSGTGEANATVTISESGSAACTATVDGSGNWTCTLVPPISAVGEHVFSATQTDTTGNISSEGTKTIKVVTQLNHSGSAASGSGSSAFQPNGNGQPSIPSVPNAPTTPTEQSHTNTECTSTYFSEKARFGTQGEEVKKIQEFLKEKGYYYGKISGFYGAWTELSVKHFQEAYYKEILIPLNRIEPTGIWSYSTMGLASKLQCN